MEPLEKQLKKEVVIIGGGLTGLTLAFMLERKGIDWILFERSPVPGGVMQTKKRDGFIYETGPNTGITGNGEVVELFEMLAPDCNLDLANHASANRWILRNGKWVALPSGLIGGIKTPLFSFYDKFRILAEPFRKRGTNPMETVANMVRRRMGKTYLDNAVDPFISGIYAGDPDQLVTKYALPKLYNLEQNYGSFIGGSIKKSKEPKSERDKKATRQVFAAKGGFSNLINALVSRLPKERLFMGATDMIISKAEESFTVTVKNLSGEKTTLIGEKCITTTGGYGLKGMFDFISDDELKAIIDMKYAKVVQVIMAFKQWNGPKLNAFGGLIPSKEKRNILGVLFPSSIFTDRTPEGGALLSTFMGGIKKPEIIGMSDEALLQLVHKELDELLS
ncbi:MAG: protoporphyrinogen oxidase, partial [Bacteroidales bacterium]|nr:protoporphyrinogen oxidase [Bacteroidales bacterium]